MSFSMPDFAHGTPAVINDVYTQLADLVEFKEFILQDEKLKQQYAEFQTFKILQKDINGKR